jgi:hypothetical protein
MTDLEKLNAMFSRAAESTAMIQRYWRAIYQIVERSREMLSTNGHDHLTDPALVLRMFRDIEVAARSGSQVMLETEWPQQTAERNHYQDFLDARAQARNANPARPVA